MSTFDSRFDTLIHQDSCFLLLIDLSVDDFLTIVPFDDCDVEFIGSNLLLSAIWPLCRTVSGAGRLAS